MTSSPEEEQTRDSEADVSEIPDLEDLLRPTTPSVKYRLAVLLFTILIILGVLAIGVTSVVQLF